jgi:hypothetical protein
MINLLYYAENGEIVQTFGVPEFAIPAYIPPEGLFKLEVNMTIGENTHYVVGGELVELPPKPDITYIFDYSSKTWIESPEIAGSIVRDTRNSLLADADILIFKAEDLGQDTTALRQYRQALRDITKQQGFPLNVTFPTIPQ